MRTPGRELEKSFVSAISLISNKIEFTQALQSLHHYSTSHYITWKYTYTYICVQCLIGHRSLDHTMSKQRNKFYSVQERKLIQEFSQTWKITVSKRRSHSKSSFESNTFYESSLFPPGNPFDQIQPTFPH